MGLEAATKALLDAGKLTFPHTRSSTKLDLQSGFSGITYDDVQVAFVGYVYGDSTSGQVRFAI